jgi:glycosyltransferase involved in cell wall biosynthesis
MNSTPLISIVIPTYNRAYIIEKTLYSIIAQTYANWECIIVDDGSTDPTFEVIDTFLKKDTRFRFYRRPDTIKKGASACRNFGYEKSVGDYIQWFDSDDLMHPDKLKIKLEIALKNNADVIVGKHSDTKKFEKATNFDVDCFTSKDFYIDFILGKKPVITNDVMLKRNIIGINRFDEYLHHGEEYEFFSRVFNKKLTYCFLEVALSYYHISPDSISRSGKQSESLIYLSKLLKKRHCNNLQIVANTEKQGRKTYKSLMINRNINLVFKNFVFFKDSHQKSSVIFFIYMIYNFLIGKGFDKIKP